jgi:DNA-directed RNA polymerase-3 subunit RPC5
VFASVAAQAQELVLPALHKGILNMSEIRSCLKQSNSSELHSLAFLSEPELLGTLGDNVVCIDGACALLSLGDVVIDPLRKILLKLFKVKGRTIKRVDIMKSARAELEVLPSNPAFMRCLRDVCLSRGASWVFRSGIDHHMPA